jgi:hypothetical protein
MSTNDPDIHKVLAEIKAELVDIRSKIPRLEVGNLQETVDRHHKEIKTLNYKLRALENADQTPQ